MAGQEIGLPVNDLKRAKVDRQGEAKRVAEVLENTGFACIDNVDGIDHKGLWDACQWFFSKPFDFKKKVMRKQWNEENSNLYRGYFPVVEGEPSRKEGFEFGRDLPSDDTSISPTNWFYEKSTWPEEDGTFPFQEFLKQQYEVIHKTCMDILELCAVGLGIPEDSFYDIFGDKPCSTFRLLHYPLWEDQPPSIAHIEDGKILTTPEHTDSGFMTLLTPFHFSGLEVKQVNGEWGKVTLRENSLVMNIGDTFSRMLGDDLRPRPTGLLILVWIGILYLSSSVPSFMATSVSTFYRCILKKVLLIFQRCSARGSCTQ